MRTFLFVLIFVCSSHTDNMLRGEESRPNVLFISVEDWNDWVGCLGNTQAKTPHVDSLVALEVKCSFWSEREEKLKSTKSSEKKQSKISEQVEDLVLMGFDRAGLLDMVANEVKTGSWIESGFSAGKSLLKHQPLPSCPF